MLRSITGQVAWVTGAGSGIGAAGALALAQAGAAVVLTGRTRANLEAIAAKIEASGGKALVAPADVAKAEEVQATGRMIEAHFGRCDVLVNSAGFNIPDRSWARLSSGGFEDVIGVDLLGSVYATQAVLPMMRKQGDGVIVHVASWASRYVMPVTGAAYTAAKQALRAVSESLNQEEFVNGIRSVCLCPAEVATEILDKRPVPVPMEERVRMMQTEDLGDLIAFVAQTKPHICIHEILLSPTWNRLYVEQFGKKS